MKKKSHRRWRPACVAPLEGRRLLAAALPTATWIGQDGHDLAQRASVLAPDQVQDIHVALAGLPTNLSVVQADIIGYQGGEWEFNGPVNGPWAAALLQAPGAATADLYMEPYQVETGRYFWITLTYSDQSTVQIAFQGGTADPSLRMPGSGANVQWLGQDGHDWTSPDPAVGPDGFQDADIAVTQLSATVPVQSAILTASGGGAWAFGTNPNLLPDAELIPNPNDSTQAHLYFSTQGNLNGQTLTLSIDYADGTVDSTTLVAGQTNSTLLMPRPAPVTVAMNAFTVSWAGQDGQDLTGPGDVHLALTGLPTGHAVVAAQLTDGTLNSWDFATNGVSLGDNNILPQPLVFQLNPADPTQADVDFPPIRDESKATMTLRLVLDDGTNLVTTFAGGAANPGLRSPQPAATSVVAAPGADLNALANAYGSVHLTAGIYHLSAPLVLNQPVTITADPGTTLLFAQGPDDPTWTAAIKIRAGNTTLSGFAVRFAGPINWTSDVSYGPAVIGTTDNDDPGSAAVLENIVVTGLDLEAPPAASAWEPAPGLIRVVSAQSGVISDNILKGGTTEFVGGPWQVVGNTYEGTVPGTFSYTVFAGHFTHDLVLANNQAEPVGPSGKTYRFLVLTQSGIDDVVQNNNVVGIGPMDDDTEPNPNASEVVLTESYNVMYEGVPLTISPDGRIVQISGALTGTIQAGDVLSILAGPEAGQWRRIALELNPTTFLLASPISLATTAISISMGFVNESFVGNTIDTTGSSTAADLVLAGNQFGVQVRNNTLIGGDRAFWITAYPTQSPSLWGWTHAPVLDATISGNTIQDTVLGGLLEVEHGSAVKSNINRVYLSASLTNNTGIWTAPFLAKPSIASRTGPLTALTVGMAPSSDPGELLVAVAGNQVEGPPGVVLGPTMLTVSAVVNGQAQRNQATILPTAAIAAPLGLAMVNDTGISGIDGQTSDAHLRFSPVALAAGYEYSLTGAAGTYLPVTAPDAFLPQGLISGFNSVFVRAYDVNGNRGPDALIEFAYVAVSDGTATDSTPRATRTATYFYGVSGAGLSVVLGTSIILTPEQEAAGPIVIQVYTVGLGGNGPSVSTNPTIASGSGVDDETPSPTPSPTPSSTPTSPPDTTDGSPGDPDPGTTPVGGSTTPTGNSQDSGAASDGDSGTASDGDSGSPTPPSAPTSPPDTTDGSPGDPDPGATPADGSTTPTGGAQDSGVASGGDNGVASGGDSGSSTPPASAPSSPVGDLPAVSGGSAEPPPVTTGNQPPPAGGDPVSAAPPAGQSSAAEVPAGTLQASPAAMAETETDAANGEAPIPPSAVAVSAGTAPPAIEVLSHPAAGFALTSGPASVAKAVVGKTTHGPGWKRHPNPFRKATTHALAVHGHPIHRSTRHRHPTGAHH